LFDAFVKLPFGDVAERADDIADNLQLNRGFLFAVGHQKRSEKKQVSELRNWARGVRVRLTGAAACVRLKFRRGDEKLTTKSSRAMLYISI
jgi:hypothetical protein